MKSNSRELNSANGWCLKCLDQKILDDEIWGVKKEQNYAYNSFVKDSTIQADFNRVYVPQFHSKMISKNMKRQWKSTSLYLQSGLQSSN